MYSLNGLILTDFDMVFVSKFITMLKHENVPSKMFADFQKEVEKEYFTNLKPKQIVARIDEETDTVNVTFTRPFKPMSTGLAKIGFDVDEGSNFLSWTMGLTNETDINYMQTELTALTQKLKWALTLV